MAILIAQPTSLAGKSLLPNVRNQHVTSRELITALFRTLPPTLIMTALFSGTGALAYSLTNDVVLGLLTIGGAIVSAYRIGIMVFYRSSSPEALETEELTRFERRFAFAYLCFALILGLFGARLFYVGGQDFRIVASTLTVGYAAGVSAGIYVRPWICIPAILLGTGPLEIVAAIAPTNIIRLLAIILVALTIGGVQSALGRYRAERDRIDQHQQLASLGRLDELTSLPNQLAFADELEMHRGSPMALHLIAVERLSCINREFGYSVGDQLVAAVASRLAAAVSFEGFIARLTGGQFAVLEFHPYDAFSGPLLTRLTQVVSARLQISGQAIAVTATIKTVYVERESSVSELLAAARAAKSMTFGMV